MTKRAARPGTSRHAASVRPIVLCGVLIALPVQGIAQVPSRSFEETFRIGGVDAPEYASWGRSPALVTSADGMLFVRSRDVPEVSVFDADGAYLRTIGRSGEGPGEFQVAFSHGLLGDTLWIIDFPAPRVAKFLTDGTHVSTVALPPIDYGRPFTAPQSITALLEGGRAIAVPAGYPLGVEGRLGVPVLLDALEFRDPTPVVDVVMPQGLLIDGVGVFGLRPFPIPPLLAVDRTGTGFLVADWDERDPTALELIRYSPSGEAAWRRTIPLETRRVGDATRSELLARGIEMASSQVERARREGRIGRESVEELVREGLHIPELAPPTDSIVIGSDGSIWLRRPEADGSRDWLVLDAEGTPLFRAELPRDFEVRAATADTAWGTVIGELDIPYVVRLDAR